jgi:DNA mismatch endonuclease (patch repair protein)
MCDFVFPNHKLVVECDGDFWHANPLKYAGKPLKQAQKNTLAKDKSKNAYIKKVDSGSWTLLRFWESDIKKDVKSCVDKIEQSLR